MAYSFVTYTGDGATDTFSFGSIPLLDEGVVPYETQLVVTVGGVTQVPSTYTIDSVSETVTFVTAPASATAVRIARVTKADDRYVDWLNSTNLNQADLNLDSDQLLFLTQESLDGAESSIQLDANDQWDAQGKILANLDDGIDSNDAVTVQQLNAAIYGGTPGSVQGQGYINSSDNTTTFVLPSMADSSASDINVFRDGTRLQPGVDYSVSNNADGTSLDVVLTAAPFGALIEIVWVTGILAASLAEGSVENNNLVDGTITPSKLANPGGNQLIINNPTTGPEWRDLVAADLNRNNTLATALGDISITALSGQWPGVMGTNKIQNVAPRRYWRRREPRTLQQEIALLRSQINADQSWGVGSVGGVCYASGIYPTDYSSGTVYGNFEAFVEQTYGPSSNPSSTWFSQVQDPDFLETLKSKYLGSDLRWTYSQSFINTTQRSEAIINVQRTIRNNFRVITSNGGKQWYAQPCGYPIFGSEYDEPMGWVYIRIV